MRYLTFALLTLLPSAGHANVKSELAAIEVKVKACNDRASDTAAQNECSDTALKAADKVLARVYRATIEELKHPKPDDSATDAKDELSRLIGSERAWVSFKESDCKLQGVTMLGGTGEGTIIGDCLYRMTRDRAKDLDVIFPDH